MAGSESVEDRIARLLLEKLHVEIPSVETDLVETGVIDSMGLVELLVHLEQEFGLRVTFEELEVDSFRSARKIAEFVTMRTGAKTGA